MNKTYCLFPKHFSYSFIGEILQGNQTKIKNRMKKKMCYHLSRSFLFLPWLFFFPIRFFWLFL